MVKRRARLTDSNDPLNPTEQVLAGYERVSKSVSQPADKSDSQEDDNIVSQLADLSVSQPLDSSPSTLEEPLTSQQPMMLASQQEDNPTIQPASQPTSHPAKNLTSQQANKSTSQLPSTSTLQPVEKSKPRKSTFQISTDVLERLDQLHLLLQLELGKANAPYKEVIVEEAITQLLAAADADRTSLIEALIKRQKNRE